MYYMYILVYMKVTQQTQDWGNSTGIRLPKKVLQTVRWQPSQTVTIDVRGQSLILTPVRPEKRQRPNIEDLLEGVTPEKVRGEIEWGSDRGKEVIND
jgi:antitoxin MazE